MKKYGLVAIHILILLFLFIMSLSATAETYGDLTYEINKDYTITITACSTEATDVTIPEQIDGFPVVAIGEEAFSGCEKLTNIHISKNICDIGYRAFANCFGLKGVNITDLTSWCNIVFSSQESNPVFYGKYLYINGELLTDLVVPDDITSIGNYTFRDCRSIESVVLNNSVTNIGAEAFAFCENITSVTIPNSVTNIGREAFKYCENLGSIYVTDITSYLNIEYMSYRACPMYYADKLYVDNQLVTELVIPENAIKIPAYAFYECDSLTSVTISGSVESIGDYAFYKCQNLSEVIIADGVHNISNYAFYKCNKVTIFDLPDTLINIGDYAFAYCEGLTDLRLGNGVKNIGEGTFGGCRGLTSITIPQSVTNIGRYAFNQCWGLKGVNITDLQAWCNIDFSESTSNPLYYARNLYINNKLAINITIPEEITDIKDNVFIYCSSIMSVTILGNVRSIRDSAFRSCTSLKDVYYSKNEDEWNDISIEARNEYIINATKHYLCIKTSTQVFQGSFVVKPINVPEDSYVIFVCYKDNKMTYIKTHIYKGENTLLFTPDAVYDDIRVMIWNAMDSLAPLCEQEFIL